MSNGVNETTFHFTTGSTHWTPNGRWIKGEIVDNNVVHVWSIWCAVCCTHCWMLTLLPQLQRGVCYWH